MCQIDVSQTTDLGGAQTRHIPRRRQRHEELWSLFCLWSLVSTWYHHHAHVHWETAEASDHSLMLRSNPSASGFVGVGFLGYL